jgi:hypothetical protein
MGEIFRELYERDCPQCGNALLVISFPTVDEIRAAVASGNQEAISMLKNVEAQEVRQVRWKAEQLVRAEQLPDLDGPVVTATIVIGRDPEDESSDTYLELSLNDQFVHREPGFYETIEPLQRIVPLLRTKYGERLKSIDTSGADLYLYGDRIGSIAEAAAILKESGLDNRGRSSAEGAPQDDQP